jgi:hypothetical protein
MRPRLKNLVFGAEAWAVEKAAPFRFSGASKLIGSNSELQPIATNDPAQACTWGALGTGRKRGLSSKICPYLFFRFSEGSFGAS